MGRRKRKQEAKYLRQFARVIENKRRRFKRFLTRNPGYSGPMPKAKPSKKSIKEGVM